MWKVKVGVFDSVWWRCTRKTELGQGLGDQGGEKT